MSVDKSRDTMEDIPEYYVDEYVLKSTLDFSKKYQKQRSYDDKFYDINGTIFHDTSNVPEDIGLLSEFEIKPMGEGNILSLKYCYGNRNGFCTPNNDNDQYEYNSEDVNSDNETETNVNHSSYASIAKKTAGAPDYLYVKILNDIIKIKYNHWHMIAAFKHTNELYCMVCKEYLLRTQKQLHCTEEKHLNKLKSFEFDQKYPNYFIRQIDARLYHCGLCNNLVSDIREHIDTKHKKDIHIHDTKTNKTIIYTEGENTVKVINSKDGEINATNATHNKTNDTSAMEGTDPKNNDTSAIQGTDLKNNDTFAMEGTDSKNSDTSATEGTHTKNNDTSATEGTLTKNNDTSATEVTHTKNNDTSATKGTDPKNNDTSATKGTDPKNNDTSTTEGTDPKNNDTSTTEGTDPKNNDTSTTEGTDPKNNDTSTTEGTDPKNNDMSATEVTHTKNNDTSATEGTHPKNNETTNLDILNNNENTATNCTNQNEIIATEDTLPKNDIGYEINNITPDMYNDVIINQYGCDIRISFIAYNLVCRVSDFYHCIICDFIANNNDMSCHVKDPCHKQRVRNVPFLNNFSINLIRMLGCINHCAICNEVFYTDTQTHILEAKHVNWRNKALALVSNHLTMPTFNINPLAIESNRHVTHQSTNGMNPILDSNQRATYQPAVGLNPPTMGLNQRGIYQPAIGLNPQLIPQPLFMPMPQHRPQLIFQPIMLQDQRLTSMNQSAPQQPVLNIDQWPTLPKTRAMYTPNMNPYTTRPKNDNKEHKVIEELNQLKKGFKVIELDDSNESKTDPKVIDDLNHSKFMNPPATDSKEEDITQEPVEQLELIGDILNTYESFDDDFEYFNDKFVYLKHRNTYTQIDLVSYNSLVNVGDGSRYCFVCSSQVCGSLKGHVNSLKHTKCMDECKFVEKYEKHLLRQICFNYHCGICNVVFTQKYIDTHTAWPPHLRDNKTDRKTRKNNLKSGSKSLNIQFKKNTSHNENKMEDIKILLKIEVKTNICNNEHVTKKNKIIIFGDFVLKISWDSYHGFVRTKCVGARKALRCALCVCDVRFYEVSAHVAAERHSQLLDKFLTQHLPHLIRKVNDYSLHCAICNTEVANNNQMLADHLNGSKHKKNYSAILADKSSSLLDNSDVLYLS
ncbi:uncharacterized protein LOC112050689 isoform X2 [Bicyclus anynana]|uniref:Uncharacterized protein LOC112050689 isoform X2 n=1 Tax=Bicyclus anynana TaxID=110368 RepID=A0A6J1NIG4_BICAN|nr:uncharacterized protein LOC112050689 isoform X2 [Bicyclus anynana]